MHLSYRIVFSLLMVGALCISAHAGDFSNYHRFGLIGGSNSYTEIKVGYYNPADIDGGLIFGLASGTQVDEAVSFGIEVDFWRKVFEEKIEVGADTSDIGETTRFKVLYEHTAYYIPILATLKYDVQMAPESPVTPFVGISGGYAFAHLGYKYNDTYEEEVIEEPPDEGFYGGWNWRVFAGVGYTLGSMSKLNIGAMYNGVTVSKSEEGGFERELDLKGFGFYASISLVGM
ncbi:MAG: hypothetical protein GF315_08370 [candidate division Zixibacteria bacterium]|nr:hypothetical protein [candidate division Zixibacteria bacterium]